MALALTVAVPASAQTIAELQALIAQLTAQINALSGGTSAPSTSGYTFTRDLTIGSTGADVTALQQALVSQSYLVMPAGTAYGYFGTLTQSAVARWQAANGIAPAAGYFGPVSRTRMNSVSGTPGIGLPTTPTTPGTGITTPGVEGRIVASVNATPASGARIYEGDNRAGVLGIRLEARTSDIRIERVLIELPGPTFYNRVANRVYIMDGSSVVGSADLNSNNVVRENNNYSVTISGMNYIVPRDATRVLTVAFDINSTVASEYRMNPQTSQGWLVTVPLNGIRGVDGAGINQLAPETGSPLGRNLTIQSDPVDQADLRVSSNTNSPSARAVIATQGNERDEALDLELLRFDVRADRDSVRLLDLTATTTVTNGATTGIADLTTAYLYDGSTMIASASVTGTGTNPRVAFFQNIDYTIPRDATRTLSVRFDVVNASTTERTFVTSVHSNTMVAENSRGELLGGNRLSGEAIGQGAQVRDIGPEITLSSRNITKSSTQTGTSTAQATFNIQLRAVGGPISASSTEAFDFTIFSPGGDAAATTVTYTVPSNVVTYTGGFTIPEGATVTIPVDVIYTVGPNAGTNTYAIGLDAVHWGTSPADDAEFSTTFMAGRTEWRTSSVVLP